MLLYEAAREHMPPGRERDDLLELAENGGMLVLASSVQNGSLRR